MPSLEFPYSLYHGVEPWDRFIRNRGVTQQQFLGVPTDSEPANADNIIGQKLYSHSEETYKRLVASTLSLRPPTESWDPQWPVKPRRNPHLGSPQIVLDLPNIRRYCFNCNIMDWSATSYLTVAFPKSVYLWHSPTNRTLKIETKSTSCLKWNPEGTAIFIASRNGAFKYSDMKAEEELTSVSRSTCHIGCFITCSAFHPTCPVMYTGCSLGSVCAFHVNKGLHIITRIHEEPQKGCWVMNIRLSSDGRHLALSSMLEQIYIYDTVNFAFLFCIPVSGPSRAGVNHSYWDCYVISWTVVKYKNGCVCTLALPCLPYVLKNDKIFTVRGRTYTLGYKKTPPDNIYRYQVLGATWSCKLAYPPKWEAHIEDILTSLVKMRHKTLLLEEQAIAWHPWKRNLLVVTDCNGVMALYNMLAPEEPEALYLSMLDSSIMNVAFNPISAELVVSHKIYQNQADIGNQSTDRNSGQLNVLSSFNRVVDRMVGHFGPVYHLNWSPDGTQLATAGADETARIWDFLLSSTKQRTKKESCKLDSVSASLAMGSRMGLAIR